MIPRAVEWTSDRQIATALTAAENEGWPFPRSFRRSPMKPTTTKDVRGGEADAEVADGFGITRVSVEYFHYGEYRYTSLEDAIAQAKRDQATARRKSGR